MGISDRLGVGEDPPQTIFNNTRQTGHEQRQTHTEIYHT